MPTCPDAVKRLIERFDQQAHQVRSPDYNETTLRVQFINPLFAELGWDVDNRQGFAPQYAEVVHEDRVKVAGATKAPDYSFRVGGNRKFFLEAKKPFVKIKEAWEPAYQLRRYAWSAKLAVSLLTDFEELAIYDGRIAPKQLEKPAVARREYIPYTEYESRWDFIDGTFGKRAVMTGAFDLYAAAKKGRGAQAFDDAFLEEIEDWRKRLANNLALRNPALDAAGLNFAVQRIIDRIIFLRICEDRGVEPAGRLQQLLNGDRAYARLVEQFHAADARYNSGLFHFKPEPGRDEGPDDLTPGLDVDDATLKHILKRLYYPESPYEFTVVSADILGSVYERFLGSTIELTAGHRAKIEPKPEVRKAGGVYYTPVYIVDYIVKQTVGKLLDPVGATLASPAPRSAEAGAAVIAPTPMTPKQAAKLKILDPACGSGSFLLGAYQYLLDWHLQWYVRDGAEKHSKGKDATLRPADRASIAATLLPPPPAGATAAPMTATDEGDPSEIRIPPTDVPQQHWALTTRERKRILLDNLHGVDIDYQAVEVTKLSLLLRCLEGETAESIRAQMTLFRERALPDLGKNILCGNSLIGTDIMATPAWGEMGEEEQKRVNAFGFEQAFPSAFGRRDSGFDAVIGNPPYDVLEKDRNAASWPHVLLADYVRSNEDYAQGLGGKLNLFRFFVVRAQLLTRAGGVFGMIIPLSLLADISTAATRHSFFESFDDVSADCFPQKDIPSRRVFQDAKLSTMVVHARRANTKQLTGRMTIRVFPANRFEDQHKICEIEIADLALLDPDNLPVPLVDAPEWGLLRKLHTHPKCLRLGALNDYRVTRGEINQTVYREFITADNQKARLLKGVEVRRYGLNVELQQGHREWFDEVAFLKDNGERPVVSARRIATQRITGVDERLRIVATIIDPPCYFADSTNSVALALNSKLTLEYLLTLLNSALMQWRFKRTSTNNNVGTNELNCLPIYVFADNKVDRFARSELERYATALLADLKREAAVKLPQDKERLRRQIDATDRQIDQLVYQLYGLSDDEIKLVEASTA